MSLLVRREKRNSFCDPTNSRSMYKVVDGTMNVVKYDRIVVVPFAIASNSAKNTTTWSKRILLCEVAEQRTAFLYWHYILARTVSCTRDLILCAYALSNIIIC